ncbi:MAG: glycine betaine/L-proline ABC transporter substrate-binding protein ProX [Parvibaculaceae bacterium]
MSFTRKILAAALAAGCVAVSLPAFADEAMPGKGVVVQPGQDNNDGDNFQTLIVVQALRDLGYDVKDIQRAKFPVLHLAVANGDVTFIADHWEATHQAFYDKAGGAEKMSRAGEYVKDTTFGYSIDTKTANAHGITNFGQLKDPEIAKLFDTDGDGKADLVGCMPGWGCERDIEHHLDAYGLRNTVTHNQGEYDVIMADTIARYKEGKPILYYSWTPYWVEGALLHDKDVIWLEVPFSANPQGVDTKRPDGKNYGAIPQTIHILANKDFIGKNPAAAKLFEVMSLPVADVSAQNLRMKDEGRGDMAAAAQDAAAWIAAHRSAYDDWLKAARAAAQ